MSAIRVLNTQFPKHGRFIYEGSYNYFLTPEGLPAFAFRWQGMIFSGSKAQFVFARDVVRIFHISNDVTRSQARWSGFSQKSKVPGILPALIFGAIGAVTARTSNIKGFVVYYNNEDGHLGAFFAVASPEIVDEIFRSIPPDRHEKDPEPPTEQPAPPPAPTRARETHYHVAKNGQELGEFHVPTIHSMVSSGELSLEDFYFDPAANEWREIACMSEERLT